MEVGVRDEEAEETPPLTEVEVGIRDEDGEDQDGHSACRKRENPWARQVHGTRGASKRAQAAALQEKQAASD